LAFRRASSHYVFSTFHSSIIKIKVIKIANAFI